MFTVIHFAFNRTRLYLTLSNRMSSITKAEMVQVCNSTTAVCLIPDTFPYRKLGAYDSAKFCFIQLLRIRNITWEGVSWSIISNLSDVLRLICYILNVELAENVWSAAHVIFDLPSLVVKGGGAVVSCIKRHQGASSGVCVCSKGNRSCSIDWY